jgi:hypothetical protein
MSLWYVHFVLSPITVELISRSLFKLFMYAVTPLFDVSERTGGKSDKRWKSSLMGKKCFRSMRKQQKMKTHIMRIDLEK